MAPAERERFLHLLLYVLFRLAMRIQDSDDFELEDTEQRLTRELLAASILTSVDLATWCYPRLSNYCGFHAALAVSCLAPFNQR